VLGEISACNVVSCVNVIQRTNWLCKFGNKRINKSKCVFSGVACHNNLQGVQTDEDLSVLYAYCSEIPKCTRSCWSVSTVWGRSLSCSNRTHFGQLSSAFTLNCQLQLFTQHLSVMCITYCHTPSLIMLKEGPYKSQNRVSIIHPTGGWGFNLFLMGDVRHFIRYSMFALWLMLVDPHFIISNSETQKGVTFLMILMQQSHPELYASAVLSDVLEPTLHKLYRSEACCRWFHRQSHETNLQLVCHFICYHPSELTCRLVQCPLQQAPWSFISDPCSAICVHDPFIHALLHQNTITIWCLSPQKSNHYTLLCFDTCGR
jgi:hypothetical protein